MNIKKFVLTDDGGFEYQDIAHNETIRFELEGCHIDIKIEVLNGKPVLSVCGTNERGFDQLIIKPRVANSVLIGF